MRNIHKCGAICLALILTVCLMPAAVFAAPVDVSDNIKVTVNGYAWEYSGEDDEYSGSGTEADPFTWESLYNSSKKDQLIVKTNDPLAKVNGQYGLIGWKTPLAYGINEIDFVVTSSDGAATAYYHVTWERRKEMRQERVNKDSLYIVPASPGQSDGKICGLDPTDVYDYRLKGADDWQTVSGTAEISGLAAGTYEIKFGETATHYAADKSWAISLVLGDTSQTMDIRIEDGGSCDIAVPDQAVGGQRVDFRIRLEENQWVQKVSFDQVTTGDWSTRQGLACTFVSYTSDQDGTYYNGYFLMPAYSANKHVEFKGVTLLEEAYYTIAQATNQNADTTITPADEEDTVIIDGVARYKEGSSVTIAIRVNQGFGTAVLKSFQVCDPDGTVVADSPDGAPVTVTVRSHLQVANVVIETIPANFTAMEEQLARVEGVNLYVYTDDTRTALELKLELAKQMYKLTQKDQPMLDDFVVELKAAIDGLIPKEGDFTAIEKWMDKIPDDLSAYTAETVAALTDAKEAAQVAVDEGWNRLRQDEIDALAAALEDAVEELSYKDADYSAVEAAIQKAEALSPEEYVDFTAVQAAIDAVVRGKNITEQAAVDQMAKAIEDAIAGLQKKPAPVEPTDPENPSAPQTGEANQLPGYLALALCAGGALVLTRRRIFGRG